MFCVSLSHKTADVSLREQFAHGPELLSDLSEGVFLSTCNRVEVYGVGNLYDFVNKYFREFKTRIFIYEDEQAVRHLYKVAAGLDSLVLGEDEILGQLKAAFQEAQQGGHTGYELNTVFKGAITAAKKVKTDTLLSKSSVSVATLTAAACNRYAEEHGFSKEHPCNVLVIGGSGDTGHKVLKDLLSMEKFQIFATVREHGIRGKVTAVEYRDRYRVLPDAHIVVSATKSPHFTLTAEKVPAPEEKLLIDLAVPRDIDPAIPGVVTIDHFRDLARHNNTVKQSAAKAAEAILEEELETLFKELSFHKLLPLPEEEPLKKFIYHFRDTATAEEFDAFTNVLLRMEDTP